MVIRLIYPSKYACSVQLICLCKYCFARTMWNCFMRSLFPSIPAWYFCDGILAQSDWSTSFQLSSHMLPYRTMAAGASTFFGRASLDPLHARTNFSSLKVAWRVCVCVCVPVRAHYFLNMCLPRSLQNSNIYVQQIYRLKIDITGFSKIHRMQWAQYRDIRIHIRIILYQVQAAALMVARR